MDLKGKVAIVTGAGGDGIGNAIALELAKEGANVVTNDIKSELADRAAEQIKELGVGSIATYADVASLESTNEMAEKTLQEFKRIDILVAIPYFNPVKLFMDMTEEEWHKIVNITFFGMVNAARSVLPTMIEQKS